MVEKKKKGKSLMFMRKHKIKNKYGESIGLK